MLKKKANGPKAFTVKAKLITVKKILSNKGTVKEPKSFKTKTVYGVTSKGQDLR